MIERKSVGYVALDLPRPISVNNVRRPIVLKDGRRRLANTREYEVWKTEAGLILNAQRLGCVKGPYALTIGVNRRFKHDLGNVEKAISDLLQEHGLIENDRLAQMITIKRSDHPGVSVLVCSTSGGE
jgi:crossover junction endodeoxyribonuclease RusA